MNQEPCGCSLDEGRCKTHRLMMEAIHAAYFGSDDRLALAVYARSDGYGVEGLVPPQGYDWSGIRDSSIGAIERMHDVVVNSGKVGAR